MPGIVGVIRQRGWDEHTLRELHRMAEPVQYVPAQETEAFSLGRCAGAVVGYGQGFTFLKAPKAQRDGVVLWMDGEVYPDACEVRAEFVGACATIQRADYCLDRYLEGGPGFVRNLNGSFVIAVFDSRSGLIHLFTDRFGSRSLFCCESDGEAAFATSVRCLLRFRDAVGRSYDRGAVAELIVFERVFGDKTLFTDIRRIRAAGRATWDGQVWRQECYLSALARGRTRDCRHWRDAARALGERMRVAIAKRTADAAPTAVLLSGGLDSRLLLSLCPPYVVAATFCNVAGESEEARTAAAIAKVCRVPLIDLPREVDYYARIAGCASELNEGLSSFVACHTVGVLETLADAGVGVVLTGYLVDAAFKGTFATDMPPCDLYPTGPAVLRARRLARLLAHSPLVRRAERQDLLTLALSDEMKDVVAVAREAVIQELAGTLDMEHEVADAADLLGLVSLCDRASLGFFRGNTVRFMDRSPMFDNDLFEFAASIPSAWKRDARLVRGAIAAWSPRLGRIKDCNTGLPAGLCPPWYGLVRATRQYARAVAKRVARVSKTVASFRRPPDGRSVFTVGSWHDLNAALRCSPAYREVVETAIEQLPGDLFDVGMIRHLLTDDLAAPAPRLRSLFEVLVTFGLFDRKWGPRARQRDALSGETRR